jgi:hypothetical protein
MVPKLATLLCRVCRLNTAIELHPVNLQLAVLFWGTSSQGQRRGGLLLRDRGLARPPTSNEPRNSKLAIFSGEQ